MTHNSETREHLVDFISYIETQFSIKLKFFRSHNDPEFLIHDLFLKL